MHRYNNALSELLNAKRVLSDKVEKFEKLCKGKCCLLYTSPSPRDY